MQNTAITVKYGFTKNFGLVLKKKPKPNLDGTWIPGSSRHRIKHDVFLTTDHDLRYYFQ